MTLFTYNDTVRIKAAAPTRPGALASVVGINLEQERGGEYLAKFPHGVVYTVEFEDGSDADVPEGLLEAGKFPGEV